MYQNKVTLIGFLGNDAEVRTNDNRSLTTLSLATKSSYKKDGKYIEHTEWHRCVVFGKLGEFAATLKKGAHIQVEGELRSRKYTSTKTNSEQTIWEDPGELDSEARSGRESWHRRAGRRRGSGRVGRFSFPSAEARLYAGPPQRGDFAMNHRKAQEFLTRCFAPGETIALLLRRENPVKVTQRSRET